MPDLSVGIQLGIDSSKTKAIQSLKKVTINSQNSLDELKEANNEPIK